MIYRKSENYELWGGCHPSSVGCISEGRKQCDCKYHVIDMDRTKSFSFNDFQEADKKFCDLTGEPQFQFTIIKQS